MQSILHKSKVSKYVLAHGCLYTHGLPAHQQLVKPENISPVPSPAGFPAAALVLSSSDAQSLTPELQL